MKSSSDKIHVLGKKNRLSKVNLEREVRIKANEAYYDDFAVYDQFKIITTVY